MIECSRGISVRAEEKAFRGQDVVLTSVEKAMMFLGSTDKPVVVAESYRYVFSSIWLEQPVGRPLELKRAVVSATYGAPSEVCWRSLHTSHQDPRDPFLLL